MEQKKTYNFRKNANKNLIKTWDVLLQDFSSIPHPIFGGERIVTPDKYSDLFNPRHIFMVFVTISEYFYEYHPMEKVEWFIPIKYKGVTFQLGSLKYGFRIYIFDEETSNPIIVEFLDKIHSLIKLSDGLLEPYIKQLITAGNFTVKNEFGFLNSMYSFFKDKLLENEKQKDEFENSLKETDAIKENNFPALKTIREMDSQSFYYFYAMMDSFFSLLEHICVLFLAMDIKYQPNNENILDFIFNTNWTEKYNRIFKDNSNQKFQIVYNEFQIVKEKYRNTFTHGGFEKNGNPAFIHIPTVGAVPIALSKYKDTVRSTYLPVKNKTYKELINIFDGFFSEIDKDVCFSLKGKIIISMDEIVYSSNYHDKYIKATKTKESLDEFFEIEDILFSRHADMDW